MSRRDEHPIVFFDGFCVLCNGAVDYLLRSDREGRLRFASLDGETAARLLPPLPPGREHGSLIYLDRRGMRRESDALLAICERLGGWWRIPALSRFLPKSWRDALYRGLARRRYRWFGRTAQCRVMDSDERFLP